MEERPLACSPDLLTSGGMLPHCPAALLAAEPRLAKFVQLAKEKFDALEVWLFGSRARGDHRADSDWDLMVVFPDDLPYETLDALPVGRLGREVGLVADVVGERRADLLAFGTVPMTLQHEVLRDGVRIA